MNNKFFVYIISVVCIAGSWFFVIYFIFFLEILTQSSPFFGASYVTRVCVCYVFGFYETWNRKGINTNRIWQSVNEWTNIELAPFVYESLTYGLQWK